MQLDAEVLQALVHRGQRGELSPDRGPPLLLEARPRFPQRQTAVQVQLHHVFSWRFGAHPALQVGECLAGDLDPGDTHRGCQLFLSEIDVDPQPGQHLSEPRLSHTPHVPIVCHT